MAKEFTGTTVGAPGGIIGLDDAATEDLALLVDDGKWRCVNVSDAEVRQISKDSVELHAADHESGGVDELDGDVIDIDWNPTNYTPTVTPTEVTTVDQLTAHLAGIDTALASVGADVKDVKVTANDTTPGFLLDKIIADAGTEGVAVTWSEIGDGGDEDLALSIDGDTLVIDFNPVNSTPTTAPTEVTTVDQLTAHLAGIDAVLADVSTAPDQWMQVHEGDHTTGSTTYRKVAELIIDFDRFQTSTPIFHWDQVAAVAGGASVRLRNITDASDLFETTGITTTGLKTAALTLPGSGVKKLELQQKKDAGGGSVRIAGGMIVAA